MRFLAENWLWGLAALPLLIWLMRRGDRVVRRRLRLLLGKRADEYVERPNSHLRQWRRFLLLSTLLWLLVALARPQWGAHEVTVRERGADIVIALDISNSMLAEDIPPNRIERAKAELEAFVADFPRGRVGLVLFAGAAFVQCPLTLDYGTAQLFLRLADPDMISEQGTALAAALATSRDLLGGGGGAGENYQAIILVTDGEDLEGDWQTEVERCRDAGIVILSVGVGLETGGLIPQQDSQGRSTGFMKDTEGNVVLSRLDIASLEKISMTTGGSVFRIGGSDGLAGSQLRRLVERLGQRELEERRVSAYEERFVWPLGLAFLSLLVCLALCPRRRPALTESGSSADRRSGASAMLLLLSLGLSLLPVSATAGVLRPAGAGEADDGRRHFDAGRYEEALHAFQNARAMSPDDARLSLAVGETLFELGRIEEAASEFQRVFGQTDNASLLAEALYNSGSAALAGADHNAAADLLRQSLIIEPDRLDALRNLEIAARQIEQEQQQEQEQKQEQQEQQEQKEEQQEQDQQQHEEQQQEQQEEEEQSQEQPQDQEQEQSDGQEQQELSEEELSREQALNLLRALDRDEEELKRSVEKRLKGKGTTSGKRW